MCIMARDDNHYKDEYRQLLQSLKGTVEGLLISQVSNVWNIYGGLNRLHTAMEKIFKHGCRVFGHDGEPDIWIFIQGLSWLQPSLAASPSFLEETEENLLPLPQDGSGKAWVWLYKSLEGHTLSQKLSWLVSDREHLFSCFEKYAFLCQEKYSEATLICLRAVEQNQPSLLTEIDPCLYLNTWNFKYFRKTHRRCSSFPETEYSIWRSGRGKNPLPKQWSDGAQQPGEEDCMISSTMSAEAAMIKSYHPETLNIDKENKENPELKNKNNVECQETQNVIVTKAEIIEAEGKDSISKAVVLIDCSPKLWSSLPNLTHVDLMNGMQVQNITVTPTSAPTSRKHLRLLRSGSHTLPSSPAKKDNNSLSYAQRKLIMPTDSSVLQNCRLSPSVLEIDYSSELQTETPPPVEKKMVPTQKMNKHNRYMPVRNFAKEVMSKKVVKPQEETVTKAADQRRSTNMTASVEMSSSSSDTPVAEFKKSDENVISRPCIRPSELKLSVQSWDETEDRSSTEHLQDIKVTEHNAQPKKKREVVLVGSAPEHTGEWLNDSAIGLRNARVKLHRKSFIESGGGSVLPMATGFFPRPAEGQSLLSFLSSGQFSRPSAELDRENAHFSISEAMIAAIEQVKCNRQLRVAEEVGDVGDESDEEINNLKQRIRLRRRQRQEEKRCHLMGPSLLSDGRTDTTTTDQSVSPLSSSPGTPSESISTDDVDDLEVDEVKNLSQLKDAGLSMSMASLYSEADLSKHPTARASAEIVVTESVVSAESVALSLLRRFSEKQLPRASELRWLVSEQDAPQQLLPLPTSWPVSPDEAEDLDMRQATPLRGTIEWAPPRPQVIFTPHPVPVRRVQMAKQNYRCAGCGMKVAAEYAHRFRYCEYLGRYFCTGCHTNQLAFIPGRVLTKWDFTRCPVSSFSYHLLDEMSGDPLFSLGEQYAGLYRKVKPLERTRQLRTQLYYLKDFIFTCRFAEELQEALKKEPVYLLTELDSYSMQDLLQVKSGELVTRLKDLVTSSINHVKDCQLCQAHGFVCELCRSQEVIFPWHLNKVIRCNSCGACFHDTCIASSACPRCERIKTRRESREVENDADF